MAALVYPDTLPCPQSAPYSRAERRGLSDIPGKRRARTLWRDRLGTEPVQFVLTFEQTLIWRQWFENVLLQGGAWFAAPWRLPSGRDGVYRFMQAPSYPEFVAGVGWRVVANLEVRGRGMPPQTRHVEPFDVDLDSIVNCGLSSAVGITVSGLNPADVYVATLRTVNNAWCRNVPFQDWFTDFFITLTGGDPDLRLGSDVRQGSAAAAYAAFPAGGTITGHATYVFWLADTIPADNTGVLQLRFTPQ